MVRVPVLDTLLPPEEQSDFFILLHMLRATICTRKIKHTL